MQEEAKQRLVEMPRGIVRVEEWFLGVEEEQQHSLSLSAMSELNPVL